MSDIVKRDDADSVYVSVPRPDKAIEDMLRMLLSGSHREAAALQVLRLPDDEQRGRLIARLNYLTKSLHADRDKVRLLVTQMLRGYRARSTGEGSGLRLVEDVKLFERELMMEPPCPTWAVALVCSSIRFGRMDGVRPGSEPPTALVRRLCDELGENYSASRFSVYGSRSQPRKFLPTAWAAHITEYPPAQGSITVSPSWVTAAISRFCSSIGFAWAWP